MPGTTARTWLPTGRALVGSILVASAIAGVLVAHRAATRPPTTRYVVVTDEVEAGDTIAAGDLGTITVDLPREIRAVPGERAEQLIGRVARVPLGAMDLLRDGDLFEAGRFDGPATTEVAVDLPPAAALLGTLDVGDRVDVLSTDPDRSGTTSVATGVVVTQVGADEDGGIGASGTVRIRLGLPDAATAAAVVDAAVRTQVTLVMPTPASAEGGTR